MLKTCVFITAMKIQLCLGNAKLKVEMSEILYNKFDNKYTLGYNHQLLVLSLTLQAVCLILTGKDGIIIKFIPINSDTFSASNSDISFKFIL